MHKYIRQIFSVFALVMIALIVMRLRADMWPTLNWLMVGVAAIVCLLVFRCFLYIFNFSYALACIINGALIAIMLPSIVSFLLGGLMVLYGLRLFAFSWSRTNSDSYASRVANVQKADAAMPFAVKIALWVQCTLLYTFHLYGVYMAAEVAVLSTSALVGAAILLLGIVIEGVADAQKQAAKAKAPNQFASKGLFARWRHPNYVGEILVQLGLVVVGVGAVAATWGNLAAVIVAPLYIILLMVAECGRADADMDEKYGSDPEFQTYRAASGSFLPKL